MSTASHRTVLFIISASVLVVFAFIAGFLLSTRNTPPGAPPVSPPDLASQTPPTPHRGRGVSTVLTSNNASPAPTAGLYTFDATIYDLRLPPALISQLDDQALSRAAINRDDFEKSLAALGSARPLYRAYQSANFNQEQYWKIANAPPTPGKPAPPGQTAPAEPGAVFDLILHPGETGSHTLDIAVSASFLLHPPAPHGAAESPLYRNIKMQTQRSVSLDQPFLIISADATALDSSGNAVALVARINLASPPPSPTTRANEP